MNGMFGIRLAPFQGLIVSIYTGIERCPMLLLKPFQGENFMLIFCQNRIHPINKNIQKKMREGIGKLNSERKSKLELHTILPLLHTCGRQTFFHLSITNRINLEDTHY
jgi:hypothetical protein